MFANKTFGPYTNLAGVFLHLNSDGDFVSQIVKVRRVMTIQCSSVKDQDNLQPFKQDSLWGQLQLAIEFRERRSRWRPEPIQLSAVGFLNRWVMGFDPSQILYLNSMAEAGMGQGDFSKINLLGASLEECQCHYKPAERMAEVFQIQEIRGGQIPSEC